MDRNLSEPGSSPLTILTIPVTQIPVTVATTPNSSGSSRGSSGGAEGRSKFVRRPLPALFLYASRGERRGIRRNPRALATLSTVENSGFPSLLSALFAMALSLCF